MIGLALLTEGESPNCRANAELTRLKATSPTDFNHTIAGVLLREFGRAILSLGNLNVSNVANPTAWF